MNRKLPSLAFIMALALMIFLPTVNGISAQTLGSGKMYCNIDIASEPQTTDPAQVNVESDLAGAELLMNIYDPLIMLKGTSTNSFVPWLASAFKVSGDGLTYLFEIRQHVPWHDPSYGFVTPSDVKYSLQKILVRDYAGSSAWMFWRAIFGINTATDYGDIREPTIAAELGRLIDNAITNDATSVTVKFATGKAYPSFLTALARACGGIQCKQYDISLGDWDPSVDRLSDGTWVRARNPSVSPIMDHAIGSGPYMFNFWWHGTAWGVIKFDNYWGGWGTSRCSSLLGATTNTRGYLTWIFWSYITSWATRCTRFIAGTVDSTYVPADHRADVWQQPGIKCRYPLEGRIWTDRYWMRDWVHGWYYNSMYFPGCYFYSMWKEDITTSTGQFAGKSANWEDINDDGKVDVMDLATCSKAFGAIYIDPELPPYPSGIPGDHSPNWDSRCDINIVNKATGGRGDMKIDVMDLATMCKLYGFVGDPWTPAP